MLEKDVIISKISIIKNCLNSIQNATGGDPKRLEDFIVQDAYVLNLQRAIQACIGIANTIIAKKGYEVPATYKGSFEILHKKNVITKEMSDTMGRMVGFRNIAIHEYQSLDLGILQSILVNNLKDIEEFYTCIYNKMGDLLK